MSAELEAARAAWNAIDGSLGDGYEAAMQAWKRWGNAGCPGYEEDAERVAELEGLLAASADAAEKARSRMQAHARLALDQRNAAEDALRAAGFVLVAGEWRKG